VPATSSSSVETPISRIARCPFSTSARRRGACPEEHPRRDEERRAAGDADGEQLEHAVRRDERDEQRRIPLLAYSPTTLPSTRRSSRA
jgi:hypothetical protein